MTQEKAIRALLEGVREGAVSVDDAEARLLAGMGGSAETKADGALLDTGRKARTGFAEVVYCAGKTEDRLVDIFKTLFGKEGEVLGTRATPAQAEAVMRALPQAVYDPESRVLKIDKPGKTLEGCVAVCAAGTSDIFAAEEAAQTAEFFGTKADRLYDVGVSGLHRLLSRKDRLDQAHCVIAVAGMEGALGSVLGGLSRVPVIAVPTSVGYGASFGGVAALLSMINSCANGIAVVNIDNGYGAGYLAAQINRLAVSGTTMRA
ncbi:MAG: nickel pincer cofactor biosynthesis protein LarB [Eubacteriaceae bacterium]|nr:nickel pincer cofactor biosynthesis protein LarB [Eubacteriaceae bacterium]